MLLSLHQPKREPRAYSSARTQHRNVCCMHVHVVCMYVVCMYVMYVCMLCFTAGSSFLLPTRAEGVVLDTSPRARLRLYGSALTGVRVPHTQLAFFRSRSSSRAVAVVQHTQSESFFTRSSERSSHTAVGIFHTQWSRFTRSLSRWRVARVVRSQLRAAGTGNGAARPTRSCCQEGE